MLTHILYPNRMLTFMLKGQLQMIDASSPLWNRAMEALQNEDEELLLYLSNTLAYIAKWSKGTFHLASDNKLFWGNYEVVGTIADRIRYCIDNNLPLNHILNFYEKLKKNPSQESIEQLYHFLEQTGITIDPDGYIIACKAVDHDWKDIFSRTIDNSVGKEITVDRSLVDSNPRNGCSHGLHVGSIEYVKNYGRGNSHFVFVRVDPANVVSVPEDHSFQKMRCCAYTVLSEFKVHQAAYLPPILSSGNEHWNNVYDWQEVEEE